MAKVGYIGLGIMGASMARNLMKAGHELVVHNRSRAIVDELAGEGATPASSPAEVAQQVDFVFTNVPDSPDVEKVVLGPDGIIEAAREGLTFVDDCPGSSFSASGSAARRAYIAIGLKPSGPEHTITRRSAT
jgi:3-hydroxyisobutyrate dehydrogenase-like beta-hydroxyacid dehydrogenase